MNRSNWAPRIGWTLVLLVFVAFVWGMNRRGRLEATGDDVIRMLFVPSVEQGTLVERGDELARFIREDSGLILRSEVPTSYAAVIQALGTRQADVARAVVQQRSSGNDGIRGIMLESHLHGGRQEMGDSLAYGVSITDACLGFEDTRDLLLELAERLPAAPD